MKNFVICSFALFSAGALLYAQLNVPQIGIAHYADGSVHLIRGIGANMIVGQRLAIADTASFSDSTGLVSSNGAIRLLTSNGVILGQYQTDESSPLVHVDSAATSAVVWLPSKHVLLRWDGAHFTSTPIYDSSFGGTVSFVNLASNTSAQFFVTRSDQSVARVSVALPAGQVTSSDTDPTAQGSIFVQQGWSLSPSEQGLTAEKADGTRQTIPLTDKALPAGDLRLEQMSNHWLHISSQSSATSWAVYLDQTKVNVFLLPPPAQKIHLRPAPPAAHEVYR